MTSKEEDPIISFDDDDTRPYVQEYAEKAIFHVGDKVYLMSQGSREGMYLIASVAPGKCTLCHENGLPVRNGDEIAIEYLEAA